MFGKLSFYVRHSVNDMQVNRQRTFFALLCIAAGIAAIVSLQTVALMMGDTLTGNLQESNRGDIAITVGTVEQARGVADGILQAKEQSSFFSNSHGQTTYGVRAEGIAQLQSWIDTKYPGLIEMTFTWVLSDPTAVLTGGTGTSMTAVMQGTSAAQVTPILIDPAVYPFYGQIEVSSGSTLSALITAATDMVVDQKVAEALGVQVGDTVRVTGADTDFVVRGIVSTDNEVNDPTSSLIVALYGFYYLHRDAIQYFDNVTPMADTVYLKLADTAQAAAVSRALLIEFPYLATTTVDMLAQNNRDLSDRIHQLVSVVGLISLLLGSIGIVNTMQVIVRRRTVEVAVLKTVGLQAGEVTTLFLIEALIMGVIGSVAGILLGWMTTFVIKGVAEGVVAQQLPFRIALMPVVNGLIVGSLVTTIFGFLPTLAAGHVRPGAVLRPNDTTVTPSGRLRTLVALAVVVVALSAVASVILDGFSTALIVTISAFIAAGVLLALLSILIWMLGHIIPSLGIIDVKLSLRQMMTTRARGAVTLLALVVGVFSLSVITLFADSVSGSLSAALGENGDGNVVISLMDRDVIPAVTAVLDETAGVAGYQLRETYNGQLVTLQQADGTILTRDQLRLQIAKNSTLSETMAAFGGDVNGIDQGELGLSKLESLTARDSTVQVAMPMHAGRELGTADAGKAVIVFTDSTDVENAGLQVGDKLTYAFGEGESVERVTFELVGIAQKPVVASVTAGSGIYIPSGMLPRAIRPAQIQVTATVAQDHVDELRSALSSVHGAFMLETAVIGKLIASLLATFRAFPTMVALLGLVVGGVVIANSVALTTMERRREIAVMKSVGLQRERVLGMLLLENGLMGLAGGAIGVSLGLTMVTILLNTGGTPAGELPYGTAILLMLVAVAISLIAATTTAWRASGEQPLNVLRYE